MRGPGTGSWSRGWVAAAIALASCATEYRIEGVDPGSTAGPTPHDLPPVAPTPPPGEDGLAAPDVERPTPPAIDHHQVVIGGGERATVADYLFVVDSSASMQRILDQVLDGFEALSGQGVFPEDARIAVMNTLPADPLRQGVVHPGANRRWWLQFEPGFGGPVDSERITVFRELAPPYLADRFQVDGCGAWFAPDDKNDHGVPCLVANTQVALFPVGVEAGLTALGQRLERDPPLFRTGAAVNVVYVSDTHDPGVPPDHPSFRELLAARPTFRQLETLALSRQPLASFRVHAIAPASVCTAEDWSAAGAAYFEAAREGGGRMLDSCTAGPGEYVELVRHIATDGAVPQRSVIPVPAGREVAEVLVDGEPTLFTISADGRAITLPGELPSARRTVDVRYRPRPAQP